MPILNYTTEVPAAKSIAEIQKILLAHKAAAIMTEYEDDGTPHALSFKIKGTNGEVLPFKLPANAEAVYQHLLGLRVNTVWQEEVKAKIRKQAERTAWRIIKDWVEAQMAVIDTKMVPLAQVFMPYLMVDSKRTLYDAMVSRNFMLGQGEK